MLTSCRGGEPALACQLRRIELQAGHILPAEGEQPQVCMGQREYLATALRPCKAEIETCVGYTLYTRQPS